MLHMIVNTHNPESCAFRSVEDGAALAGPFERFAEKIADAHQISVQGSWVNRPAHEIYMLVDAPNAHTIEEALLEAGLVGRTHSKVLSVVATQDVDVETE
jgi:hypothetical protein